MEEGPRQILGRRALLVDPPADGDMREDAEGRRPHAVVVGEATEAGATEEHAAVGEAVAVDAEDLAAVVVEAEAHAAAAEEEEEEQAHAQHAAVGEADEDAPQAAQELEDHAAAAVEAEEHVFAAVEVAVVGAQDEKQAAEQLDLEESAVNVNTDAAAAAHGAGEPYFTISSQLIISGRPNSHPDPAPEAPDMYPYYLIASSYGHGDRASMSPSPRVVAVEDKTCCSRVDTDKEIALDRPSPSVAAKKKTGGRSRVPAEAELAHPYYADSWIRGRITHHLARGKEFAVCRGARGFNTSARRLQHRRRGKCSQRLDDDGETSINAQIKNTVTICLDGKDGEDVLESYSAGITAILEWCRANGKIEDVSKLFGPDVVEVFTTPAGGTYYLVLKYSNRSLELVFSGRDLYMMGWRGPNGAYEIKSDSQDMNYMSGNDVTIVDARRNYEYISPDRNVGRTKLGIYEFRRAFDELYNFKGGSPKSVEDAIGKIAVFISEATRLQGAFDTVCESLKHRHVSRLNRGKFNHLWVTRYGRYCREAMQQIDHMKQGKKPPTIKTRDIEIQNVEEILKEIRVLHIDAYNEGIFKKNEPRPKVFFEERSKEITRSKSSEKSKGWSGVKKIQGPSVDKIRNTKHPATSMGRPPRRGYMTLPSVDSACQSALKDKSTSVKPHKRSSALVTLQKLGGEMSECMDNFPALQRLCEQNFERLAHIEVEPSLQRFSGGQQSTICLPQLSDKPNHRLQRCENLTPAPSRRSWFIRSSTKVPLVRPGMVAAHHSRTINLGKPRTERIAMQKAPIQQVGGFLSKFLRLIRR